jgi:hypothetical protein
LTSEPSEYKQGKRVVEAIRKSPDRGEVKEEIEVEIDGS